MQMLTKVKLAIAQLEGQTVDQAYRSLYPPAMQDGFRRYDTAKQQHKRLPDLRPAMNEQLKKELN